MTVSHTHRHTSAKKPREINFACEMNGAQTMSANESKRALNEYICILCVCVCVCVYTHHETQFQGIESEQSLFDQEQS